MLWRIAQRDCAVAIMRPAFGANWRTAADVKSVHDHLSRHHAGPKIERARFDIGLGTSPYSARTCPPCKTGNRRREPRVCRLPPRAAAGLAGTDHFHGRARSCLTGNSSQPQPRQHHSNQFITEKNMCDDVNANKSLYGNERETPSIRSGLVRAVGNSAVIGGGVTGCEKRFAANLGVALGWRLAGAWLASGCGVRGLRGAGAGSRAVAAGRSGGERGSGGGGRDGGVGAYGMMWEKGGVWGLGVI